jgi:hypothetical protein
VYIFAIVYRKMGRDVYGRDLDERLAETRYTEELVEK